MTEFQDILEGTTINQLLSEDENRLLDTIDELRSQGIGRLLGDTGLPQLIVCGDQSSGKSSVLEALTRVRFPTKSSVCTTFPTELRLRRERKSRVSCRIKASTSRTPEQKERLASFQPSFESPEKFPELITAARDYMCEVTSTNIGAFFDDVLEVEIVGPKVAPLTIVDLPGLIHYRATSTGDRDIALVSKLVRSYIKQSNSIVLAILAAHNDINNQIVLEHVKEIIPDGHRTLGIITRPDELPSGSEKEQDYLDHARTNPESFQYGWHVVRNRSYEERDDSFEERDQKEKDFLQSSNWAPLEGRELGLGINTLRQRLSRMLLDHISLSLPAIVERLKQDLEDTQNELSKLGDPRSSPREQRGFLRDISDGFGDYTRNAIDGRYTDRAFFGNSISTDGLEKRLRACIRNLNDEFATEMLARGHKWHVMDDSDFSFLGKSQQIDHPNVYGKGSFIKKHVDTLARAERGNELPGASNTLLVGSLFRLQAEPWEGIASKHLKKVCDSVKIFFELLLSHLADQRTCNQLLVRIIEPILEIRRQKVEEKLRELLLPHKEYDPINIEPHFASKMWLLREQRTTKPIVEAVRREVEAGGKVDAGGRISLPPSDELVAKVATTNALVDDNYGSNQTFDFMQAYYDTTILNFINNVASLAVEQCIVSGLPKIFSSATIDEIDDETLNLIASESREILTDRARLSEREKVLKEGLSTIRTLQPGIRLTRRPAAESKASTTRGTSTSILAHNPVSTGNQIQPATHKNQTGPFVWASDKTQQPVTKNTSPLTPKSEQISTRDTGGTAPAVRSGTFGFGATEPTATPNTTKLVSLFGSPMSTGSTQGRFSTFGSSQSSVSTPTAARKPEENRIFGGSFFGSGSQAAPEASKKSGSSYSKGLGTDAKGTNSPISLHRVVEPWGTDEYQMAPWDLVKNEVSFEEIRVSDYANNRRWGPTTS